MIVLRNHRYEWESPLIARPGCETFGLNGAWGLYARWLTSNPSNPGGYTIYRPDVSPSNGPLPSQRGRLTQTVAANSIGRWKGRGCGMAISWQARRRAL